MIIMEKNRRPAGRPGDISTLDKYNLGDEVRRLAQKMTIKDVADEINLNYLPANEPPLSLHAFYCYCRKHGIRGALPATYQIRQSFDSLSEAHTVRTKLVKHTRKLGKIIDEMQGNDEKLSEIATISNAYVKACDQLSKLNESVSRIQKEQLAIAKVRKVLTVLLEVLDKYPEVKVEFLEKLREMELYDTIRYL